MKTKKKKMKKKKKKKKKKKEEEEEEEYYCVGANVSDWNLFSIYACKHKISTRCF